MVDVENRDVGGKLTGKVRAGISRAGLGRRALLFAASCLAAAPLVQAAWVFAMYHLAGYPVFGPWHTALGYLYIEGRLTVLPLAVFVCTALCHRSKIAAPITGIVCCVVTVTVSVIRWDYLSFGIYLLVASLLACLIVLGGQDNE